MDYDFSKKVVLVTGASAGIGEATALLLAKLGAQLALVGRNERNLQAVADKCRKEPEAKALPIVADLSTDEGVEKVAKQTLDHYGRLDVLINNAGIGAAQTLLGAEMVVFDKMFGLNVRSVYNLTRLLVPALVEAKGNVVNVSSIAGQAVAVGALPYSMSKAALDHFTRLTALELAPKGVRINTVNPGITITPFHQRVSGDSDESVSKFISAAEKCIPLRKACDPEDIAKAIVHLASDHSRLVTGTAITVDGGVQYSPLGDLLLDGN